MDYVYNISIYVYIYIYLYRISTKVCVQNLHLSV